MVDARIQKSKDALILSGLNLINKNKEVSITEIAKDAKVGRATLYRLFSSKEVLVEAIALHCVNIFTETTAPIDKLAKSHLHAIALLFEFALPLTQESQFLASLEYFSEKIPEVESIIAQQDQALLALFEGAKAEGSIDKNIPTSWLLNLVEGLFFAGWLQQTKNGMSAKQTAELAFNCFVGAVTNKTN